MQASQLVITYTTYYVCCSIPYYALYLLSHSPFTCTVLAYPSPHLCCFHSQAPASHLQAAARPGAAAAARFSRPVAVAVEAERGTPLGVGLVGMWKGHPEVLAAASWHCLLLSLRGQMLSLQRAAWLLPWVLRGLALMVSLGPSRWVPSRWVLRWYGKQVLSCRARSEWGGWLCW